MERRCFVVVLTGWALSGPRRAGARATSGVRSIGILVSATPPASHLAALREGLLEHGLVEGRNVLMVYRTAEGRDDQLPGAARELAGQQVDLIVALHTPAAVAAREATARIPVVMVSVLDPVAVGLVESLGRPGGNVTGTTFSVPGIAGKHVEIIAEAVPGVRDVGVLGDRAFPGWAQYWDRTAGVARAKGIRLRLLDVRSSQELQEAFAVLQRERPGALYITGTSFLLASRQVVVDFAARAGLPAIYAGRTFVDAGGLMSYGFNTAALYRRTGYFVDRILKGAHPGEIPVEQPTKFELCVNMKTARALGLTLPPSVLLRADQVIE